jgi:hypothetical protein
MHTLINQTFTRCGLSLLLCSVAACQTRASEAELRQMQQLDEALQGVNRHLAKEADNVLGMIEKYVYQNNLQRRDLEVLRQAEDVQTHTRQVVDYLHKLRQELKRQKPASDAPVSLSSSEAVNTLMLQVGAADTLQKRLNAYGNYLRAYVPESGAYLALDAKDDPSIRAVVGSSLDAKRFGEFYFGGTSVAAAFAVLSQKETEVRQLENKALGRLAEKIGPGGLIFYKIGPVAISATNTVEEGETYHANLFLSSTKPLIYRITVQANGKPLQIGPDGKARVEFTVPADAPSGPATWDGVIQGRYQGRDTTFRIRVPYTIQPK